MVMTQESQLEATAFIDLEANEATCQFNEKLNAPTPIQTNKRYIPMAIPNIVLLSISYHFSERGSNGAHNDRIGSRYCSSNY